MPKRRTGKVLLGRITGAHGIRGDVLVSAHTADPADLSSYGPLTDEKGARRFEIVDMRIGAKGVVVRFKGVSDRTQAEALRGQNLYVARSALPKAEDGAYYHVDLIGLQAVETCGAEIGEVIAIQDFGAGTLLEIRKHSSKQTELIPFTDAFVPTVDIEAGRVVVIMPNMVGEPEPAEQQSEDDA